MASEDNQAIITKFDELEIEYNVDGMYELMTNHKESTDPQLLWRLAYAILEKSHKLGDDAKMRKPYVYEAFEHAKKALELDDNDHNVLMWYCIILSEIGEYEGMKTVIANSFKTKEYFLKGLKLEPTSAPLMHCMGTWCYEVANVSWLERKAASAMFSTPPTATFEEALQYFEDAEKAKPGFYTLNDFMIAQTLVKLKKDKDRAKDLLLKVVNYKAKTFDDSEAQKNAKQLLQKEFSIKM